jgi:hypothetical protein
MQRARADVSRVLGRQASAAARRFIREVGQAWAGTEKGLVCAAYFWGGARRHSLSLSARKSMKT